MNAALKAIANDRCWTDSAPSDGYVSVVCHVSCIFDNRKDGETKYAPRDSVVVRNGRNSMRSGHGTSTGKSTPTRGKTTRYQGHFEAEFLHMNEIQLPEYQLFTCFTFYLRQPNRHRCLNSSKTSSIETGRGPRPSSAIARKH